MVRCSGLERSRRSKMFYCNIRTPVHRIAIPKVMWLLYPKFWVQTFGIATLWTGVSVFCNLHTAFPLYCPVCVPRPRSDFYCHRSRFRSWSPAFRRPASSLHSGTSKSAAARTICKSYSCIAFYFLTPSSLRCNSALPQHNNASSTPGPVLTTSSTASDYEDDCWYGTGRFFRCGDRCVWWTTTCSCGNTTLDFLKLSFSQYCCPQSAPCEQVGSGVHCPDGKVLDISEQCEDKCYNDWRTSEVLDPLNSNFKCEKSLGRDKKSLCLPTAEMCQGLEICGEVDICNKNDLRCPRNQNNKISSARIFTPSGLPEVTIRNLPSQLTSDHYY